MFEMRSTGHTGLRIKAGNMRKRSFASNYDASTSDMRAQTQPRFELVTPSRHVLAARRAALQLGWPVRPRARPCKVDARATHASERAQHMHVCVKERTLKAKSSDHIKQSKTK
jgi:hypothetical protein